MLDMAELLPQCQNLKEQVDSLKQLLQQEPSLASCEVTPTQTSSRKAISPKFEIVFAGAFSAGKSILINALLERELLYSQGHVTGTECKIEYAHSPDERVVLTFLSEAEVREQVVSLCEQLGLHKVENLNQEDIIEFYCNHRLFQDGSRVFKTSGLLGFYGSQIKQKRPQLFKNLADDLADFNQLRARMIHRLDELLDTFPVADIYKRATLSHPCNATAPLLAILVEALYYLASQLVEDILVESSEEIFTNFSQRLNDRIPKAEYYKQLYRLLGNDGCLEQQLQKQISLALKNAARVGCNRFVRESPRFYDEGTFSIYQFCQTLQQTSQTFDCQSMVEAEPVIKQLLKLDFEPKVCVTIRITFRQTIIQSFKTQLLPMAEKIADEILRKYHQARTYLEKTLEIVSKRSLLITNYS